MDFTRDNILLDVKAASKEEILLEMSEYAKALGFIRNTEEVYEAFKAREMEYSTGLQDGFAIPHAKTDAVLVPTVLYARSEAVLDWETFDDNGVNHVFALLVPKKDAGTTHLVMLSKLATALMEEDFKEKVKVTTDVDSLAKIIKNEMQGVG